MFKAIGVHERPAIGGFENRGDPETSGKHQPQHNGNDNLISPPDEVQCRPAHTRCKGQEPRAVKPCMLAPERVQQMRFIHICNGRNQAVEQRHRAQDDFEAKMGSVHGQWMSPKPIQKGSNDMLKWQNRFYDETCS